ncbi:MAG: 3-deoxy-manno-octulosonate cytidylyltransferase [Verrucomicrobiales bacterium]
MRRKETGKKGGTGVLGVIPARWDSSRFPGKPLHAIAGKPLIQHVWERCRRCRTLSEVIIATDDERIRQAALGFGAVVEMTRPEHPSGTDRIAEVARRHPGFSHILNIQGDEPLIGIRLINRLVSKLTENPEIVMITAANRFSNPRDLKNPNIVKVVLNKHGEALYFSRSAIPFQRQGHPAALYRHQGIYGFSRSFLLRFVDWKPTPLEKSEHLEQLRALENGASIHVVVTSDESIGVDTPAQARLVSKMIQSSAASRNS